MLEVAQMLLVATTVFITLALACYVVAVIAARAQKGASARRVPVTPDGRELPAPAEPAEDKGGRGVVWFASKFVQVALVLLTASMITRTFSTGTPPFTNHYEFAVSFAWGMIAAQVYFQWRYRIRMLSLIVLPVILAMLLYCSTLSYAANPLMPALQNSPLLTLHVFCAAVAYGAAVISFGTAIMYLLAPKIRWHGWPKQDLLDEVGYKSVIVTFPMLTIMIILGAVWANIAWGRYWSWDPKETAALVTWLIYGAYLHARVVRDWRGNKSAWLLVLGFLAIIFTYFGNLWFGGLHAYA